MTAKESGPKGPVTIRLKPAIRTELNELAQRNSRSVSAIVAQAVEELLARQLNGVALPSDLSLDASELERLVPVAQAIGASIPLKVLLAIVEAQRAAKI